MNSKIKFIFTIASPETRQPVQKNQKYTKIDKGKKFLCGVISGQQVDAHGDRMSENAINGMIEQSKTKDILLYVNHGKDFTNDIGILRSIQKLSNGDLYAEFELFDNEEANKVWLQANGLPPYKNPKEFGFSVEGFVPEEKISFTSSGRIIDYIELDPGVSLVSKPAYTPSIVQAIEKSFRKNEINYFEKQITAEKLRNKDFIENLEEIENAMSKAEDEILTNETMDIVQKESFLRAAYSSYVEKKINLFKEINFLYPKEVISEDEDELLENLIDVGTLQLDSPTTEEQLQGSQDVSSNITEDNKTMKEKIQEIINMLQEILDSENQEAAALEQVSNSITEAKSKNSFSLIKSNQIKRIKALKQIIAKSEDLKENIEEEEAKKQDEEEEKEIKSILDVESDEESADSDESGVIDTEEVLSEQDSELQEELLKSLGFSQDIAKTIVKLNKSKNQSNEKSSKKFSSKSILLAKELANSKKEIMQLKKMLTNLNTQNQTSVQVQKGFNSNLGQRYTMEDVQKILNGEKVNKNLTGTVSDNSVQFISSIFGGMQ
jgi:hypothetical protein